MSKTKPSPLPTAVENDLPEGWAMATLTEVIGTTGFFSDGDWIESKDQDVHGNVRLIQLADVGDGEYRNRSSRFLTREKADELSCSFLVPGDILVARMPDPLGRACMFPGDSKPSVTAVDVCIVRPGRDAVDSQWLMHTINSPGFRGAISEYERGTTRKRISRRNLDLIRFPVPPLAEQKRIVAKVEALLARVNAARARLAKVPAILKRFRQSVLAAACSGQLTADWREDGAAPWTECTLRKLIGDGPQNGLYRPRSAYGRGTLIVRIANFYDGVIQPWDRLERLEVSKEELETYRLCDKDVLVNRVNSMQFLGKSALVVDLQEPCVFESNMMRFRVDVRRILPEYLIRYLNSLGGLIELRRNAKHAVNQSSINQQDVARVSVPLPSIEEQQEIVRRVEALFALADKIEARVQAATARVEKITQAILAKAFRGELVPTEAELARTENRDYEPATVLLARIRVLHADDSRSRQRRTRHVRQFGEDSRHSK